MHQNSNTHTQHTNTNSDRQTHTHKDTHIRQKLTHAYTPTQSDKNKEHQGGTRYRYNMYNAIFLMKRMEEIFAYHASLKHCFFISENVGTLSQNSKIDTPHILRVFIS